MLDMAATFSGIAGIVSAAFGGPFHDAKAIWQSVTLDSGGSVVGPATVAEYDCQVQTDLYALNQRPQDYEDGDVRLFVLRSSLSRTMDSDCTVNILSGPHAGAWLVSSVESDPMGVYWQCKGRRA